MEFTRVVISFMWAIATLVVSGFVLWRKLRHERVDFEDRVIDRALLATVIGVVAGRLVYILLHINAFGWVFAKWISLGSMPGMVDVVSLAVGLLVFWLMLGKDWKDPVEILDYSGIGMAFFLFLIALGDALLQIISYLFLSLEQSQASVPIFEPRSVIVPLILAVGYFLFFIFLSKLEKQYRTFLWYRAKRRSAQTGFVFAVFLMGYGLLGITLGWLQQASVVIAGINFDPIFKLLVGLVGIVILYLRSGRRG
jgi:hypothetical protein